MSFYCFHSHKTAIKRNKLSAPVKYLVQNELLKGECLDFGCGKGFDCDTLGMDGYDIYYRPEYPTKLYDTIMCNYVLNVLPELEWSRVLDEIYSLLKVNGIAYIAVRNDKSNLNGITSLGTYQVFVDLDLPVIKKTSGFIIYKIEKKSEETA